MAVVLGALCCSGLWLLLGLPARPPPPSVIPSKHMSWTYILPALLGPPQVSLPEAIPSPQVSGLACFPDRFWWMMGNSFLSNHADAGVGETWSVLSWELLPLAEGLLLAHVWSEFMF